MREALGAYSSPFEALNVIVANRGRCLQTSRDVGVVNDVALRRAVRPHTSETIRLEFKIDGETISLRWVLSRKLSDLSFDAEKILHMVAQLVRDDVGLGEFRIAAAESSQFIPETQIDVDLFIRRAVERAALRLSSTAP